MIYIKSWMGVCYGAAIMYGGYLTGTTVVGILHGTYAAQPHAFAASMVAVLTCVVTGVLGYIHGREGDYDCVPQIQIIFSILCGMTATAMLLLSLPPGESRFNAELTFVATTGTMFVLGATLFFPSFGWRSRSRY